MVFVWLILGVVGLLAGARVLVMSATGLADFFGVPPVVIGLTVVAYGTSTPELFFSLQAALTGHVELAVANVIGSNVFNVFVILGLSSTILPLAVHHNLLRIDVPLLIGLSLLVLGFSLNQWIGFVEGAVLLLGLVLYTVFSVFFGADECGEIQSEYRSLVEGRDPSLPDWRNGPSILTVGVLAGIGFLILGSKWFSWSASLLARGWGMTEWSIGATIVAGATSLPEVATSLTAAWKGRDDVAVANVVGSNIFNILGILGGSTLLAGDGLPVAPGVIVFDLPFMVMGTLVCLPFFLSSYTLSRPEGVVLLVYFAVYLLFLVGDPLGSVLRPATVAVLVLSPLLLYTLIVMIGRITSGR